MKFDIGSDHRLVRAVFKIDLIMEVNSFIKKSMNRIPITDILEENQTTFQKILLSK